MPDELEPEVLAELRSRLEATQRAAERLAAEAAQARAEHEAAQAHGAPAPGWTQEEHARRTDELSALLAVVQGLRDLIPPEVADALRELVRELLVLVRALLDWWLARLDGTRGAPAEAVQDVPVTGPDGPARG